MIPIFLLTGATGFVGRQILSSLIKSGIKVRIVVREGKEAEFKNTYGIESIITTKDLFSENYNWFLNTCKGVECVIHAAWYVEPGKCLESPKNIDCLIGTLYLAKATVEARVKRFLGIGTCFEYAFSENNLTIDTSLKPLTPYASAKTAAFIALEKILPLQGVEFIWCRLFYLYGEGEDDRRLVPYLRSMLSNGQRAQLTSGNQIRDFLDVKEAGQMIVKAALGNELGATNICSGIPITVRNLAEKIADEYGRRDLLVFGARSDNLVDPPYIVGNINKKV